MKEIFVDELPKSCSDCKYLLVDGYNSKCKLKNEIVMNLFSIDENCPLKLITNHDNEVRKAERERVCEEIVMAVNKLEDVWCGENKMFNQKEYDTPDYILGSNFKSAFKLVKEKLDQIKGEK
jgi:hypothetical protein